MKGSRLTNILLITLIIFCVACKRKTTVRVKVLNPALNEYVKNSSVVIVEKKGDGGGGIFSNKVSCREIASAITDQNGEAIFDNEKLRRREGYQYYCAVRESWGISQSYPCSGKTSGFLQKGGSQTVLLMDYVETDVKIQYNNVFNPGTNGDSLICSVTQATYFDPVAGHNQGGGGIGGITIDYNNYYPFPSVSVTSATRIFANRLIVSIRKRKMGVVTASIDTVKAYPNQTNVVQVNW